MEQKLKQTLKKVANEYEFSNEVKIDPKRGSNGTTKWYNKLGYQFVSVLFIIGLVFTLSPEVRSMTEKWTTQIFHLSSKDEIQIKDGYVYVDGVKTVPETEYKLAFYIPEYTGDGYVLKKSSARNIILNKIQEEELGNRYTSFREAKNEVDYEIKQPTFLPNGLTFEKIYVRNGTVEVSYQTGTDRDLTITVQKNNPNAAVMLDDKKSVNVGDQGYIGKRPYKYWDTVQNKPSVKVEYSIVFIEDGVRYKLYGTNLTEDETIKIAQSVK